MEGREGRRKGRDDGRSITYVAGRARRERERGGNREGRGGKEGREGMTGEKYYVCG